MAIHQLGHIHQPFDRVPIEVVVGPSLEVVQQWEVGVVGVEVQ